MEITIARFKLVSVDDRFDLIENKTIQLKDPETMKANGKEELRDVNVGYDMTLQGCILYIIARNLGDQDLKIDLKTYLKMWKQEKEEIISKLKI